MISLGNTILRTLATVKNFANTIKAKSKYIEFSEACRRGQLKRFESPLCKESVLIDGKSILRHLQLENRSALDKNGSRWSLFTKGSKKYIPPGSLVKVTYRPSKSTSNYTQFTGILLALKRGAADPTITIRGLIDGVGVEQVFCVFSPLISKIELLRAPAKNYPSKLYYLREKPEDIAKMLDKNHK